MKYTSLPATCEAVQWFPGDPVPGVIDLRNAVISDGWGVRTAHGDIAVLAPGDYVVTEPDGRGHYPVKPDIFVRRWTPAAGPVPVAGSPPDRPTLICTVGLPRSGKSTWARAQGVPVVNPDAIRLAVHGTPFRPEAEPLVWATAKLMVRSLFLAGHPVVILDATNTTRYRRTEWRDAAWGLVFQPFATDRDTCVARAHATGKPELVPVIEGMAAKQEPLGPNEPHWGTGQTA